LTRAATILALAPLTACWTGGDSARAPAVGPLVGNVLVWADARLYLEARDGAPFVRPGTLRRPRAASLGYAVPMRAVAERGAFVEVEATDDNDCGWISLPVPYDLAAPRLLVRRDDLAPVLATAFALDYHDGTSVELDPGVAVAPRGDAYAIELGGAEIVLPIPSDRIGRAYSRARSAPPASADVHQIADVDAQLGPQHLHVRGEWTAPTVTVRARDTVFPLLGACRVARVLVASDAVEPAEAGNIFGGLIGDELGVGDVDFLPAGTVLRSNARVVARTAHPVAIDHADVPCLDTKWALAYDDDAHPGVVRAATERSTTHLCADRSAVLHGTLPHP
jgi:hypothetical protein